MIKALVYIIYLLAMVQTILVTQTAWVDLAKNFGDIGVLDEIETSWLSVVLLEAIGMFTPFHQVKANSKIPHTK